MNVANVNVSSSTHQFGCLCVDYRLRVMRAVHQHPHWIGGVNMWLASHPQTTNSTILNDVDASMNELLQSTRLEE